MKRGEDFYPIGEEDSADEKTFLSLNFVVGETLDLKKILAMNILEHALLISSAAPLRKALIDAHIGKDVDSSFDEDYLQPNFGIIINGSEAARAEEFYRLTMSTLKNLAENGIDRSLLQASINSFEFGLREADFGATPRGLVYGLRIFKSWLYDGDPNLHLQYEDALEEIKAGLDNRYFEQLIEECLINNPHCGLFVLKPSKDIAREREEKQQFKLDQIKSLMSNVELIETIKNTKKLKARQEAPETPEALETIPLLKLEDIRKDSEILPLKFRDLDGTRILERAASSTLTCISTRLAFRKASNSTRCCCRHCSAKSIRKITRTKNWRRSPTRISAASAWAYRLTQKLRDRTLSCRSSK